VSLRRAASAALAVAFVTFSVAACGGGGNSSASGGGSTVERTRVQVVEGLGKHGFDASTIYEKLSPGVVTITSLYGNAKGLSDLLGGGGSASEGSGFVLDGDGYVATNAHVITNGTGAKITKAKEVYVQFADGNQIRAKIVGYDPNADVGVLKVDPKSLDLVPLSLGRSSSVHVGDPVAAIGSPFGEQGSLSVGVVSAEDRAIEALTDFSISNAIQTDAAINKGNSGGPLLDAHGRVIGINSQIKSSGGGSVGVGFAVPVDTVRRSIQQLRADGEVHYAYIGISSQSLYPQLAANLKVPVKNGALVADVVKGGPADKAGIKGGGKETRFQASLVKVGGDVITKVDGRPLTRQDDFSSRITNYRPGDTVNLEIYRDGKPRNVSVTLGERPSQVPSK
jgi:S1-C subfamily serine protease